MIKRATIKLIFKSGAVQEFKTDINVTDLASEDALTDEMIKFGKTLCGHGDNNRNIDAIWGLASPISTFCINTREVAFASVTLD